MHRPDEDDDEIYFKTPEEKAQFERDFMELLNDLHNNITKIIDKHFIPHSKKVRRRPQNNA